MAKRWGNSDRLCLGGGGCKITAVGDCSHEIKRCSLFGRKTMTNLDSILKSRDISLPTKVRLVKAMVFPVVMYGCESWTIKKSWVPKNWHFWTVVLKIQPKVNQPWIFIGRTDWCLSWNSNTLSTWCEELTLWKVPDARKNWRQEEKGTTENEMVGWHHQFYGHEFEQAPGVGDGQGSLACCNPWGCRVGHDWVTELNWTISGKYLIRILNINFLIDDIKHCIWRESCFCFLAYMSVF